MLPKKLELEEEDFGQREVRGANADAICNEILRITDVQFNILEGHRKGGIIYRSFLNDQSETEESESEQERTVCPPPATAVVEDPLPQLPSRSGDSEEDEFESYSSSLRSPSDEPRGPLIETDGLKNEWRDW
jgi:hypothetical protein